MTFNDVEIKDIRSEAVKGAAWSTIDKWGGQVFSFLTFLILARLLDPEDIGLVSIATLVVSFMQMFIDRGFPEAIIQRADITKAHLNTAFWINIIMALGLTSTILLFRRQVANAYNEPDLKPILAWLSINFLLAALSSTQQAILRRNLNFKGLAVRRLLAQMIGGITGVVLAFLNYGVWSLVVQNLVYSAVGVLVLWRVSDWRPKLVFSKDCFQDLYSFGIPVLGNSIVTFATRRLDEFFVGVFLGSIALGYYKVAYRLLTMIIEVLAHVATSVLLPIYSRFQNDHVTARSLFTKAIRLASLISAPLCLALGLLVPQIVPLIYGYKWLPAVPIMRILLIVGFIQPIIGVTVSLIQSMGKPAWLFIIKGISSIVAAILFYTIIYAGGGIASVAWGQVILNMVVIPIYMLMVHRLIAVDIKLYLVSLAMPIFASFLMGIVIMISQVFTSYIGYAIVELGILSSVGVITYIFFTKLICSQCFDEIKLYSSFLLSWLRKKRAF